VRVAAAVLLALAWPALAAAAGRQVALPDPHVPLSSEPPLTGSTGQARVPRPGRTREVIRVGVDASGQPVHISVLQRIQLLAVGDYEFTVPAPVRDVYAPAGAHAQPGLLDRAIVWQGFSPGRRDLVAVATLDSRAAAALPLALRVDAHTSGDRFRLVLELLNRTRTRVLSFTGRGDAAGLAAVLDGVHRSLARGQPVAPPLITADVRPARIAVETPFAFRGQLALAPSVRGVRVAGGRLDGSRVVFSGAATGARPERVVVTGTGDPQPRIRLVATPVRELPSPRGGGSWRKAVARGRAGGRDLLIASVGTMLGLARANQYETFLATPGVPEQAQATYVYATAKIAAAAPAPRPSGAGIPGFVSVAAVLLALAAAVVAWAYL